MLITVGATLRSSILEGDWGGIIERGGWLIMTYSTSYSTKFSNSIFKEVGGDLHA